MEEGGWLGPCPHLFLALEYMDGWTREPHKKGGEAFHGF